MERNQFFGAAACFFIAVVNACGLVPAVWWDFDGGAATNRGSGGAAYDAVLSGTVAFTNGISGGGLCFFGGSQGYASVPYTLGDQGTISLWYRPSRFYDFNSVYDNAVDSNQWEMWIGADGALAARTGWGSAGRVGAALNADLRGTNRWFHIAFTWDRYATTNQTRLYINGDEQARGTFSSWDVPGSAVYFGAHTGNTPAEGVMDDVRIYSTALTAAQVQSVQAEIASQVPAVQISLDGAVTNAGAGGAKYDAALRGDPVWTNGWNNKGHALALDGVNDAVSVPYRLSTSGTIALWYYVPGPWYNYNSVFDNSADANHYESWVDVNGSINFRPAGNTWKQTASYNLGSGSNLWHHIVGTWDALSSNVVLYVDGVERSRFANTNGTAWPAAGTNFYIGGGNAGNTPGRGIASDLRIYETPLTSNRVAEIYGEFGRRGGLTAYLPLDGTAQDIACSNGVVVTGAASFVRAKIAQGVSYDPGVMNGLGGSCVSVSNALGSSVGTLAMWFYARGPWYNYQPLTDNSVNDNWWEGWINSSGVLSFRISNLASGTGQCSYNLDNLRGSNSWYHIAFTWDRAAQQTKLYVDGVRRATAALTDAGWVDPNATLRIGSCRANNMAANGIWDEVRVYNRALTAEEIPALMAIPPSRGTIVTVK